MNCHNFTMFNVRRSLLSYRIHSIILIIAAILSLSMVSGTNSEESNCDCSKDIAIIKKSITANVEQIKKWIPLYNFVNKLMDEWQEEMIKKIVHEEMENYAKTKLDDLIKTHKISEKVDQITNILAKVEKVENYTKEVEEDLRSEAQARKHLETRMESFDNQLEKRLVRLNASVSQINLQVFSSVQNISKTIYGKVDVEVYKNETRKLEKQIEHIQTEIQDGFNSSTILKLVENGKNLDRGLQFINNTISDDIVPRIMMIESEAVRKEEVEGLKNKMTDLLNNTAGFQKDLADVLADIQDIKSFQKVQENVTLERIPSLDDLRSQILELKNKTCVPCKLREEVDTTPWNNEYFIAPTPTMVTNGEVSATMESTCTDNPRFTLCKLVVRDKYCTNKYYAELCCVSCTNAGQL